jgi:hypothetical protein
MVLLQQEPRNKSAKGFGQRYANAPEKSPESTASFVLRKWRKALTAENAKASQRKANLRAYSAVPESALRSLP